MNTDAMMDYLVENEICTQDELCLVTSIKGANEDTMKSILYVKTGYCNFEQLQDEDS